MQFSRDRLESRHFSSAELCSGREFSALSSGVLLFELAWMRLQNWSPKPMEESREVQCVERVINPPGAG